jgi:putative ABC transport system substrate-binding protein
MEGRNLTLEVRWADWRQERLPDLAAELVRLPVDLIVTSGAGIQPARQATTTLPIVVEGIGGNPVETGLAESLARPGRNITGLFNPDRDLQAKRLELLKEAVPGVTRIAVLAAAHPITQRMLEALAPTARELGVALHPVVV